MNKVTDRNWSLFYLGFALGVMFTKLLISIGDKS